MGFCNVNWWTFVRGGVWDRVNWGLSMLTGGFSCGPQVICPFLHIFRLLRRSIWDQISKVLVGLRLFQVGLRARSGIWTDFFVDLCSLGTGAPFFFIRSGKSSDGLRLFSGLRSAFLLDQVKVQLDLDFFKNVGLRSDFLDL